MGKEFHFFWILVMKLLFDFNKSNLPVEAVDLGDISFLKSIYKLVQKQEFNCKRESLNVSHCYEMPIHPHIGFDTKVMVGDINLHCFRDPPDEPGTYDSETAICCSECYWDIPSRNLAENLDALKNSICLIFGASCSFDGDADDSVYRKANLIGTTDCPEGKVRYRCCCPNNENFEGDECLVTECVDEDSSIQSSLDQGICQNPQWTNFSPIDDSTYEAIGSNGEQNVLCCPKNKETKYFGGADFYSLYAMRTGGPMCLLMNGCDCNIYLMHSKCEIYTSNGRKPDMCKFEGQPYIIIEPLQYV